MATSTTRLGLTKPALTDTVDIAQLNTNSDLIDAAIAFGNYTSSTRPATPFQNQIIRESDTGIRRMWDGTKWAIINADFFEQRGYVAASESTNSTTYTDLTTVGPTVSVYLDAGQKARVYISARLTLTTVAGARSVSMSWAVSGADTLAAADEWNTEYVQKNTYADELILSSTDIYTAITSGTHTFTCKYKSASTSDTITARRRRIIVTPRNTG